MPGDDDALLAVALLGSAAVATFAAVEFARGGARAGVIAGAASACASALVLIVPRSLAYRGYVSLFVIAVAVLALRRSSLGPGRADRHKRVRAATGVLIALEVMFNAVTFFATQFPQLIRSMGH